MGYHQAGFDVIGVDVDDQPSYPFEFHKADALEYLDTDDLSRFDAIHASPPCQGYSSAVVSDGKWTHHSDGVNTPKLIGPVRDRMDATGLPYVIENVTGARDELRSPVLLCGAMFGRPTPRHRLFEANWPLTAPWHPTCRGRAKAWAAEKGVEYRDMSVTGKSRRSGSIDTWREIMQMPWAERARDLSEAIYPAQARWIGNQLGHHVGQQPTLLGRTA